MRTPLRMQVHEREGGCVCVCVCWWVIRGVCDLFYEGVNRSYLAGLGHQIAVEFELHVA